MKHYRFFRYMENKIKNIEVGKFYFIHDGSKTGHPGFVVWKDDEKNRYLIVKVDSDKFGEMPKTDRGVRHITKLSHTIGDKVATSYARNRPLICKRKDIGKELGDLFIHKDDLPVIEKIANNKPEYPPSLKK